LTVAQHPKSGRRDDLHKPAGRVALETPHAKAHTASVERKARQPMRLRDYIRELMERPRLSPLDERLPGVRDRW
jgi:hypothetical protein